MSDLPDRLKTELPEDARMDAYYFSFDRTGVGAIDSILLAIARAGKAYHHTEDWNDDEPWTSNKTGHTFHPGPEPGMSYVDLIQQAANEAAALIREAAATLEGR